MLGVSSGIGFYLVLGFINTETETKQKQKLTKRQESRRMDRGQRRRGKGTGALKGRNLLNREGSDC